MVWNAIAGLAGAAASIFGGSDDDTVQKTETEVDYRAMVKAAQKAGINPLTALRNGGAAGFAAQTTTTPALASESLLGRIAQATGLVAEGLSNQERWESSKTRQELDSRLVEAQINNLNASTNRQPQPRLGGPGGPGGEIPRQGPSIFGDPAREHPGFDAKPQQDLTPWGIPRSPLPDAGVIEESHGEPAAWIYSPVKTIFDVGWTLWQHNEEQNIKTGLEWLFNVPVRTQTQPPLKVPAPRRPTQGPT